MRGARQLSEGGDLAAKGFAAANVASATCAAIHAMYYAMRKASCPPATPREAFTQRSLHDAVVRMPLLQRDALVVKLTTSSMICGCRQMHCHTSVCSSALQLSTAVRAEARADRAAGPASRCQSRCTCSVSFL